MAENLVIRIGDSADNPAHWIAVDSTGARRSPPITGPLPEAQADVGDRNVIVLVPSTEVLTTTADIPIKGGAKIQAALPYALEEYLADDVEDLHFAAGKRRTNGLIPVSVVNRARLTEWLSRLDDAGIEATAVVADSYGLARIPGTISLLVAEDQIVINDGADTELVMQGVSPADALAAIGAFDDHIAEGEESNNPALGMPRHVLVYCEPADEEKYQHDWISMRPELDSLDVKILADGVLPRLAVTVASGAGVNLLQGNFGHQADYSGILQPWKLSAMLLLAFCVVGIGAKAANYFMLTNQIEELQQQFQAEYEQIVPGAPIPRDPLAAVQSLVDRLGAGQAPQVFLSALENLSLAAQQNANAKIDAVSFRAGVVDVRLTAPDVATLDSIQHTIARSGQFEATIQSTDQEGEHVNSRIQIKTAGL